MKKDKLSVVILNYNAGKFLTLCLQSLKLVKEEVDLDIWVVDNASSDGSAEKAKEEFPDVNFIFNKENLGFTRGNNLVLKKVTTEYILILNPDTKILPGTLRRMINYLADHPEVGAASCKVELTDGSLDWASHRGFPTPWTSFLYYFLGNDRLYHLTDHDMKQVHEVDAISGSFFLTRKSVLDKVGLFDEEYFMYADDLDLSFRIKKAGYKIIYIPDVIIIHYKGIASGIKKHSQQISQASVKSKRQAVDAFFTTMKIFYRKNLASSYPFFINWLIYWGIDLKWFLAKRNLSV